MKDFNSEKVIEQKVSYCSVYTAAKVRGTHAEKHWRTIKKTTGRVRVRGQKRIRE
jgi:hypothetical protein